MVTDDSYTCAKNSVRYRVLESLCCMPETKVTCVNYTSIKNGKKIVATWAVLEAESKAVFLNWVWFCLLSGYVSQCLETFLFVTTEECYWHVIITSRDAAKYSIIVRLTPTTKNYQVQNVLSLKNPGPKEPLERKR